MNTEKALRDLRAYADLGSVIATLELRSGSDDISYGEVVRVVQLLERPMQALGREILEALKGGEVTVDLRTPTTVLSDRGFEAVRRVRGTIRGLHHHSRSHMLSIQSNYNLYSIPIDSIYRIREE